MQDIRDLVLHITTSSPPPSFLKVQNPSHVSTLCVLLIPGLTLPLLDIPTANTSNKNMPISIPPSIPRLPFLQRFMHACPTKAPGDKSRMFSVVSEFVSCEVTGEEKKRRMEERIRCE